MEAAERAKNFDPMEELKYDLKDETLKLLEARRRRNDPNFTDYIG